MDRASNSSYLTAIFLGSTSFIFLNFGLPVRADELGISAVGIGGMYTVFTGTMLLIRPLVGYCLDHFGRRWFFTVAFVFYGLSMLVFAQSVGISDFYFARFLQGIGASLMWVSARTIVADVSIAATRGQAMGRLTTTSVRGSMIGAFYGFTLLGFMPMQAAWMWAFGGYALMALMALIWSLLRVEETAADRTHAQIRPRWPRLPRSAPLRRIFVIVFLTAFASALTDPIYLLYLKNKFEVSTLTMAYVFLPGGLVYAFLPQYAGQWSDRFGRAPLIALGIALAGMVSIALPFWPGLGFVAASYILFSCGNALASPAEDALVADLSPDHLRGTIMGAREAAAGLGAAIGPLAGGLIYDYWSQSMAFVTNGVLLLATCALVLVWFRPATNVDHPGSTSGR
jgi:MFS family permease